MAYTPTNWQTGDTVTAAKLNKIEQGIENNEPLIVTATYTSIPTVTITYDTDAAVAGAALEQNRVVLIKIVDATYDKVWIAHCVIETRIAEQIDYNFAYLDTGGGTRAPFSVLLRKQAGAWGWAGMPIVFPDISTIAAYDKDSQSDMRNKVLMFTDDDSGKWIKDTVENTINLGDTFDDIMLYAWVMSEQQKTTISVDVSGTDMASDLYWIMTAQFSGAYTMMTRGRGTILAFTCNGAQIIAKCVSVSMQNSWVYATFSGYLPTAVLSASSTISGVSLYPFVIDLCATDNRDGTYTGVGTVSVEKIASTLIPMPT